MSNDSTLVKALFEKYTGGTASPEEVKQLFAMIAEGDYDEEMKNALLVELQATDLQDDYDNERWYKVFNEVKTETVIWETKEAPHKSHLIKKISIAASIAACFGIGVYFYQQSAKPTVNTKVAQNDIAPGKNTATLTLANGRRIILSDANKGVLAKEAGVNITKTASGQIVYEVKESSGDKNTINTLTTAKGETYQVRLPDGTDVWLNAASSLKYPASFASVAQRRVTLTGEAYFQVAKDKQHPFIVKTDKQEVKVLGTHFNVNSYADEPATKTTLLEGSVQVTGLHNERKVLKPGDQSLLTTNSIEIYDADTEEAVAWKNNEFMFGNDDFRTTMRKVARWYNIEVVYEASAPINLQLGGFSSRSRNISTVLKMMAKTGEVHFRVEGQKVYVSK
ncbi:FecR family protein [Pedobacter jejuensis]|nr:FecR family protein [Pedobacter jejuensis]